MDFPSLLTWALNNPAAVADASPEQRDQIDLALSWILWLRTDLSKEAFLLLSLAENPEAEYDNHHVVVRKMLIRGTEFVLDMTLPIQSRYHDHYAMLAERVESIRPLLPRVKPTERAWLAMLDEGEVDMDVYFDKVPGTMTLGEMKTSFATQKIRMLRIYNAARWTPERALHECTSRPSLFTKAWYWMVRSRRVDFNTFANYVKVILASAEEYQVADRRYMVGEAYAQMAEIYLGPEDDYEHEEIEPDIPPVYDGLTPSYTPRTDTPPAYVGKRTAEEGAASKAKQPKSEFSEDSDDEVDKLLMDLEDTI